MKLKDKVILITAGSRGIGKAIARQCVIEGARVAVSARNEAELQKSVRELKAEGDSKIMPVRCDVSDDGSVERMVELTERELGPINGLVCSAGIYGPIGSLDMIKLSEWFEAINVNLFGVVRCIHQVVPYMKKRKSGSIVLLSGGGQGALVNFSSYVASKGGIWRLTETLAKELGSHGIRVNAIAPGAVNTKFLEDILNAGPDRAGEKRCMKGL